MRILRKFTSRKGEKIVLREPHRRDVERLRDFINELSREDTFIGIAGRTVGRKEEKEYVKRVVGEIKKRKGYTVVAEAGGKIIGSCGVVKSRLKDRQPHVAEMCIAIRKKFREQGIGRELVKEIIKQAKRLGVSLLRIGVFGNNARGLCFYRSIGFKKFGVLPKSLIRKNKKEDEIYMYKNL